MKRGMYVTNFLRRFENEMLHMVLVIRSTSRAHRSVRFDDNYKCVHEINVKVNHCNIISATNISSRQSVTAPAQFSKL